MNEAFAGRRVVVVGASSGIGRRIAVATRRSGADVIAAARRVDRLADAAAEAPGLRPMSLDLRDEASCAAFAAAVRDEFEAIDALVISSGAAPLRRFTETTATDWLQALETNLIGAHRVIAGLIDHLRPQSITAVISSESAREPRSHLGAYGASKAALEHSMLQWREEHPWLRFCLVSLGATVPTEFGSGFDGEALVEAIHAWGAAGRNRAAFMDSDQVATVLCGTLELLLAAPTVDLPRVDLRSPSPAEANVDSTLETAAAARLNGPVSR